jgi:hypothetical protein
MGALALATAAVSIGMSSLNLSIPAQVLFKVEHAFKMYHSSKHKNVGQFLCKKVGDMINNYMVPASNLSDQRWMTIMEICGTNDDDSNGKYRGPSAESMQNSHQVLYTPSSPSKED